jgi:hypothetical protein
MFLCATLFLEERHGHRLVAGVKHMKVPFNVAGVRGDKAA